MAMVRPAVENTPSEGADVAGSLGTVSAIDFKC